MNILIMSDILKITTLVAGFVFLFFILYRKLRVVVIECPHDFDEVATKEFEDRMKKKFGCRVVLVPNHMKYVKE